MSTFRAKPVAGIVLQVAAALTVAAGCVSLYLLGKSYFSRGQNHPAGATQTITMTGQSMHPTLEDGQSIQFDTGAYTHRPPGRGDIVVFKPPTSDTTDSISRVIAVPGDRLRILNGVVRVNGEVLPEPYLAGVWTFSNEWPPDGREAVVPPGHYFLMGDNRNHSADSRSFGFVYLSSIMGKLSA